ncbi:4-(cytidine 5'-diphospho)-2-C-methyl-D-erythritol kinase [Pasteurella bettyae]|uniref:4-diphosphocytidyl-2-C-methyl-D-erythritol kinase n=1 Tax=Pasteurella bettyae CCUG 2042 TaxID=1095749 RepID=I3DCK7_9PAST|nr:4-(cytidine 5'-diphospho)-2-C-methyl-D-erythritol kinase [Pasteurella bettyae]EIJ69450.1 4-(cytidine 5'-diphospho)-2-C-methyl-D-erythritol kinase [Pasteurella bettyae CCUG 2042]SUB21394.1 4-diphosphocytidyl-2-C-methyl-D-erythritol kinase [Pasteurella bettyae]
MKNHQFSSALSTDYKQGEAISFPCPAKLNLFLYINGRRADGYHELQTLFQFLDYGDWLTIKVRHNDDQILLTPTIPNLKIQDNLIYRAARLLQQKTKCKLGAEMHLDKVLPIGGGVGGGSSNAATTLLALNYLWKTNLTIEELAELGLQLGADVPIFIHGKASFAEGVGEKITYCEVPEKWYLVIKPNVSISTAKVFSAPELTRDTPKKSLQQLLQQEYKNDCERIVRKQYPEVEQLLNWLVQYSPSRLTGSGACVFAEFENEQAAQAVLNLKAKEFSGFVAKGLNVSPLHQMLKQL